jgi:hypothetical protein
MPETAMTDKTARDKWDRIVAEFYRGANPLMGAQSFANYLYEYLGEAGITLCDTATHAVVPRYTGDGKAALTKPMFEAFWSAYTVALNKHGHYESVNAGYNALVAAVEHFPDRDAQS